MEKILFVLFAAVAFNIAACGEEEADECSERDTELLRCECTCGHRHDAETAAYAQCVETCYPREPGVVESHWCIDKLPDGWEKDDCGSTSDQCHCVEAVLEYHRWAWLTDFIAKERCLGPMLAKDAERRGGCYLNSDDEGDDEGSVEHYCRCVNRLKHRDKRR